MTLRRILPFLLAALLFVGCENNENPNTSEIPVTTESAETTVPAETTAAPVTEPPVTYTQPGCSIADEITKEAVDALGYGGFDFTHSVKYPKIDSDAPGAVALNEKIKALYAPLIENLRNNTEGRELYRVGFNAAYTGVEYCTLMIHFTEFSGIQYSEGGSSQRFFYYDGINDRELTVEEYLESMDVDLDKALDSALWSYDLARAGFTADYEGEAELRAGTEYKHLLDGDTITPAEKNTLYYQRHTEFADSVKLDGAYVDHESVTLYFHGQAYVQSTFSITLDRETLLPVRPNYEAEIELSFADTDKIEILFENGNIVSATAPFGYENAKITFSSNKVSIYNTSIIEDSKIVVNGGEPIRCGNAGVHGDGFLYDHSTREYIPREKLESLVIYLDKDSAPPIETAIHYERDAYNVYNGGMLGVRQSVSYPRITTGTAAAKKFNEKIAAEFEPIIRRLEDGEDWHIYDISYDYALLDGAISIAMDQEIGRQGTEGGFVRKMYYFDVTADREMTMEEYAAKAGVDIEKAKNGVLWSYDLGSAGYADGEPIYSDSLGGEAAAPEKNRAYFMKHGAFDRSVTLDGISVTEKEVVLHMTGHAFISTIFTIVLDKATLLPIHPNYYISVDTASAAQGEFEIVFENSKIKSVTLPEGVNEITVSASAINLTASVNLDERTFKLNGEKWGLEYGASYDRDSKIYSYYFKPSPYIPIEELKSITIEKVVK